MIAKYFKGGKSKSGAVEYLLNEREQLGTARTLRGNPELTKQLIKENTNKLKYRSGCLAFEEPNISEQQKAEIMDLFEKNTFAGLDKEQYNILWVEHTDKGRLELNFVIPRLELTSGKAFNPHWHEQDQTRLLKFQEYVNAEYGFTSAFSENKRELIRVDKNKKNSQIKKEIHQVVLDNIKSGHIQNREELLQFFQDSGATIPRKGKDYITVQFGEEKHRLKGEIYGESFTTIDSIKETIRATEREHKPTTRAELRELKQELDRLMEFKAETNRAKYPKREQDYIREHRLRIRDTKKEQDLQVHRDSNSKLNNRLNGNSLDSKDLSVQRGNNNHQSKASKSNLEGKVNDSIRENASRRARGREEIQQRTLSGTKAEPNGIYRRVAKNFNNIRERNKEDYTQLRAVTQRGTSEEQSLVREVFTERSNGIQHIKERVGAVVSKVKEFITERFQKAYKMLQEMKEKEANLKSLKEEKPKEKEQTHTQRRSHGHGLSR